MVLLLLAVLGSADAVAGVTAETLGLVINTDDPYSVATGEYYRVKRNIPAANIIRVHLRTDSNSISEAQFIQLKRQIDRQSRTGIQAYALAWTRPYRVECMSITTAVTMGFNREFCSDSCRVTRASRYFDSDSIQPMLELGIRPSMLLAATSLFRARQLIDRGIAADASQPQGTAYLLNTGDAARSVRVPGYALLAAVLGDAIHVKRLDQDALRNADDVMFYFTGAVAVPALDTNHFLPGAAGDHLTSTGGDLLGTQQMSSLRWLEAGATGSYGAVVEPCNFPGKFPDPMVMMKHYLVGETLLEAYWKSVRMPGQGLFIGEPLARPYLRKAPG